MRGKLAAFVADSESDVVVDVVVPFNCRCRCCRCIVDQREYFSIVQVARMVRNFIAESKYCESKS